MTLKSTNDSNLRASISSGIEDTPAGEGPPPLGWAPPGFSTGSNKFGSETLCEQLVVGGVAGTGERAGQQLPSSNARRVGFRTEEAGRGPRKSAAGERLIARDYKGCVELQLKTLRCAFMSIRRVCGDRGVSMGLSGGFDSRLMLSLALDAGIAVQPFTFKSEAHLVEGKLAQLIADRAGLDLRLVEVRKWTELSDSELELNIDDAITYYDGRTNDSMGSFNDVHTARVHRECVGDAALNLNGLGGELYRNRERLPPYRFRFGHWFWQYVAGPRMRDAFVSDEARRKFESRMACKYGEILDLGTLEWVDRHVARRWYREVWLPYFGGVRLAAENRVAPSMMPFAEPTVSEAALAATPFIGPRGEFEAEIIRRLDARIAALPSSYGYGFSSIPRHRKLRDLVASLVPISARLARNRLKASLSSRPAAGLPARFRERFSAQIENLKEMGLPIDIEYLLKEPVSRDRTLYIAEYLYRNRHRIDNLDATRTTGSD